MGRLKQIRMIIRSGLRPVVKYIGPSPRIFFMWIPRGLRIIPVALSDWIEEAIDSDFAADWLWDEKLYEDQLLDEIYKRQGLFEVELLTRTSMIAQDGIHLIATSRYGFTGIILRAFEPSWVLDQVQYRILLRGDIFV